MPSRVCAPLDDNSEALPSREPGDLNIKGCFSFFLIQHALSHGVALTLQKEPSARISHNPIAVFMLVLPAGTDIKDFSFYYQIECLCHTHYPLS